MSTTVWMSLATLAVSLLACYVVHWLLKKWGFGFTSVAALVIGIIIGLIFKGYTSYDAVVGTIYVKIMTMMVIPLLLVSLIQSVYSMNSTSKLKTIGGKALFWLLFQTFLAAIVGTVLAIVTNLGKGTHLSIVDGVKVSKVPPFTQVITDLFSENIFQSTAKGQVIPVVFFAIIVGMAVVAINEKRGKDSLSYFKGFIDDLHDIVYKLIAVIISFLPYSIIFLMADTMGTSDPKALLPLLWIIVLTFVGCIFHLAVTDSILLKFVGHMSPLKFYRDVLPAQTMAFSTRSSAGTLPLYVECLTKKVGVSEEIANFVGSLGTAVGMSGCAGIWPPLLAIYTLHSMGVNITLTQAIIIIILCPIISFGTAGVPGGGIMLGTAMFVVLGLPVGLISIFAGIDSFADMARTTTNVTSSMVASTLVSQSEKRAAGK